METGPTKIVFSKRMVKAEDLDDDDVIYESPFDKFWGQAKNKRYLKSVLTHQSWCSLQRDMRTQDSYNYGGKGIVFK